MESVASQRDPAWGAGNFCCELPTDPGALRSMRRSIRKWAADAGLAEDRLDDLVLAVDQAASSGIEHSAGRPGPIWIDGHVALGQIRVVVTDYGPRRASTTSQELGLRVVRSLPDHMHVERFDGATAITMVWDVSGIRLSGSPRDPVLADRA